MKKSNIMSVMAVLLCFSLLFLISACSNKANADQNIKNETNSDFLDALGLQGKTGNAEKYMFFSGVEPGMNISEVNAEMKASGWFDSISIYRDESDEHGTANLRTYSFGSAAQFTSDGNAIYSDVTFMDEKVISTSILYDFYGKSLSVDEFKAEAKSMYDKFVAEYGLVVLDEVTTDDVDSVGDDYWVRSYPMVENVGVDKDIVAKGYNQDYKEYHLWFDESNNTGYICFIMHYANPEGDTISNVAFAMYNK